MTMIDAWLHRHARTVGILGIVVALFGAVGHSLVAEIVGLVVCCSATLGNLWWPAMPGDPFYRQKWVAVWLLTCAAVAVIGWLVLQVIEPRAAGR